MLKPGNQLLSPIALTSLGKDVKKLVDVRSAVKLGDFGKRPAIAEEMSSGQELDNLSEPENCLFAPPLGAFEYSQLSVMADKPFIRG